VLSSRVRLGVAAGSGVLLTALAVGFVVSARSDQAASAVADVATGELGTGPTMMVLTNGKLSMVSAADPGGVRDVTGQACDRAYQVGNTIGCLRPAGPLKAGRLVVFDASQGELRQTRSMAVTGFPNRMRISPSGRMLAYTLFVSGHTYRANGFSTGTRIVDTVTGAVADLEDFAITRDGKAYRNADVNFWGVTFVDDNAFYATLSTGNHRYLVAGDLAARTVRTLAENVECPSLSPDRTRIAFKQAIDNNPDKGWRLTVLDLKTMKRTELAETRSVDDQAEWLDNQTVAYSLQESDGTNNIWIVPANGTGGPTRLIAGANSPSLRP